MKWPWLKNLFKLKVSKFGSEIFTKTNTVETYFDV